MTQWASTLFICLTLKEKKKASPEAEENPKIFAFKLTECHWSFPVDNLTLRWNRKLSTNHLKWLSIASIKCWMSSRAASPPTPGTLSTWSLQQCSQPAKTWGILIIRDTIYIEINLTFVILTLHNELVDQVCTAKTTKHGSADLLHYANCTLWWQYIWYMVYQKLCSSIPTWNNIHV